MGFPAPPPPPPAPIPKPRETSLYQFSLTNLPPQITIEILFRLPPKSIVQCRCVCRKWLDLIADPYFLRLHSSAAKPGFFVHQSKMFKQFFKLVDFVDEKSGRFNLGYDTILKFNLNFVSDYPYPDSNIVVDGSVDGFLLLRNIDYNPEKMYICNPLTREFTILPTPNGVVRYPKVVTHGFGVNQKTGEYKNVQISHDSELHPVTRSSLTVSHSNCRIYTLQEGNWRSVAAPPVRFAYNSQLTGVLLAGNLHWLVHDLAGSELISCFDLEHEAFRAFPPPFSGREVLGTLGVLRGCLSLCNNVSYAELEIWLMREYGAGESWRKEIVVRRMPALELMTDAVARAFKVFDDGSVLLVCGGYYVLYYCGESGMTREVEIGEPWGPNCIEVTEYVPSFVGLGRFVKGKVIKF